jgi:hypothetical protein
MAVYIAFWDIIPREYRHMAGVLENESALQRTRSL